MDRTGSNPLISVCIMNSKSKHTGQGVKVNLNLSFITDINT